MEDAILDMNVAFDEFDVPDEDRVIFMEPEAFKYAKKMDVLDSHSAGYEDRKKGTLSTYDGAMLAKTNL